MASGAATLRSGLKDHPAVRWLLANPVLFLGMASIVIPTMLFVAQSSWSTEQGAHGPIVLATGIWLILRQIPVLRSTARAPGFFRVAALFLPVLLLYFVARVSKIIELEGYLMYGLLLVVAYSFVGGRALKVMWFPLLYMLFVFPPPETLTAAVTNPLKVHLSTWSVNLLNSIGYPIANAGVTIQIGQYQVLVADACSGLNSLISLSAISLFYIYMRHAANFAYSALLLLTVLPVAIFANLLRILFLILITYHFGESAAQGFLHDFAGITMFMTALLSIFAIDHFIGVLLPRLKKGSTEPASGVAANPA